HIEPTLAQSLFEPSSSGLLNQLLVHGNDALVILIARPQSVLSMKVLKE
ncbi:2903_t:CDS:2, partial [Gigaspora margarita]